MSTDQQAYEALRALVREPVALPEGGLETVLAAIPRTPQRRGWLSPSTWRINAMFSATKFIVACAVVVLFGGLLLTGVLTTQRPGEGGLSAVGASESTSEFRPAITFQHLDTSASELVPGTQYLIPDLVVLSVPTSGWVHQPHIGRWTIEKGRDASAALDAAIPLDRELGFGSARITVATSTPVALYAAPCRRSPDEPMAREYEPVHDGPVGSDRADLAAAVAALPGIEVVEGPTEVIVGDLPATHVAVTVPSDAACPLFDLWDDWTRGSRLGSDLGNTIGLWIVDYPRFELRYWIAAETRDSASAELADEVERIVDSIEFIG